MIYKLIIGRTSNAVANEHHLKFIQSGPDLRWGTSLWRSVEGFCWLMEGATLLGSVFSHKLYISDNQASSTSLRVPQQLPGAVVGHHSGFGIPTARLDADFLTIQTSRLRKRNRVNRVD